MSIVRRRVSLRRGVLGGGLIVAAFAVMPAASSWGSLSAFSGDRGENGWYVSRGTVTYTASAPPARTYTVLDVFGLPIATARETYAVGNASCSVNDRPTSSLPSVANGASIEWEIPVPGPGVPSAQGKFNVACAHDVRRVKQVTYIDFIPGETEITTFRRDEESDVWIDMTPPSVATVPRLPASRDAVNTNWHNAATVVDFVGTDDGSGIASCSAPVAIDGPAGAADKTAVGSCRNVAGLESDASYVYRFDDVAPEIPEPTAPPSRNGWYAGSAEVTWHWSDRLSGIDPDACPARSTSSGEGEAVKVVATCSDWADNKRTAEHTVKVDATAPDITLAHRPQPNAAGWFNDDVTIDWSCADELSGPEAKTVSRTVDVEGDDISIAGACTDVAGNRSSDTQSGIKLDRTPPVAEPVVTGRQGRAGWYLGDVAVAWHWSDALSGIDDERCRRDGVTDREGAGQTLDALCADLADNVAAASRTIDVDLANPEISATIDRAPGFGGWYTAPVTIHYECADPGNGSGLAGGACPQEVTVGGEGVTTVTRSVTDRAGRESSASTTVKVDLADPTIAAALDRGPDFDGWHTSPVTVTFTCSDPPPGSGIADCPPPVTVADDGDRTVAGRARDHAGRLSVDATASVHVDTQPPDATFARRGAAPDLAGGRVHGSATDTGSGIRQVAVTRTHPARDPETVMADVECTDATRRVCTWSAKVPPARSGQIVVTATDRVDREDPTPDSFN